MNAKNLIFARIYPCQKDMKVQRGNLVALPVRDPCDLHTMNRFSSLPGPWLPRGSPASFPPSLAGWARQPIPFAFPRAPFGCGIAALCRVRLDCEPCFFPSEGPE